MAPPAAPLVSDTCGHFRRGPPPTEGLGSHGFTLELARSCWLGVSGERLILPSFCGRDKAEQGMVMTVPTDGFLGVPECCSRGAEGVVAGCPPSPAPIPDLPGYRGRSSG